MLTLFSSLLHSYMFQYISNIIMESLCILTLLSPLRRNRLLSTDVTIRVLYSKLVTILKVCHNYNPLEFFIGIILPIALWPWDRLSL